MALASTELWLTAFAALAGPVLLLSLLLALAFVFVARRLFRLPPLRALAYSFAAQLVLIVVVPLLIGLLNLDQPRDVAVTFVAQDTGPNWPSFIFFVFVFGPIAVVHLLIAPFLRKA